MLIIMIIYVIQEHICKHESITHFYKIICIYDHNDCAMVYVLEWTVIFTTGLPELQHDTCNHYTRVTGRYNHYTRVTAMYTTLLHESSFDWHSDAISTMAICMFITQHVGYWCTLEIW